MIVMEREGDFSVVRLPDRFGAQVAKELLEQMGADVYLRHPDLILDFSSTEFIDSTAIGVLVTLSKDFKSHTAQFLLRNLTPHIAELFADTGLEMLFTIITSDVVKKAVIDLFADGVDIRLEIGVERTGDICIFHLGGVMNHPMGSRYFKQQFLLALASSCRTYLLRQPQYQRGTLYEQASQRDRWQFALLQCQLHCCRSVCHVEYQPDYSGVQFC